MSQQGRLQASLREQTGRAESFNGDWHALFDQAGIPAGDFNGRMLQWLNVQLGVVKTSLAEAQQAYATLQGVFNWSVLESVGPPPPPTAVNDAESIDSDDPAPITGDVRTNDYGGVAPVTVFSVLGVEANVGAPTATDYGTITLNEDGTYSYELDLENVDVAALVIDDTLTDTIPYVLIDGNLDTDGADLIITINGTAPDIGPTAAFVTGVADVAYSLANMMVKAGAGVDNSSNTRNPKVDLAFPEDEDKVLVFRTKWDGVGDPVGPIVSNSTFPSTGVNPGSSTNALLFYHTAVYYNGSPVAGSVAHANTSHTDDRYFIIKVSRSNMAAQTVQMWNDNTGAYGPAYDVGTELGAGDWFFRAGLFHEDDECQIYTQAEVEDEAFPNADIAAAWALDADDFTYLSGAYEGEGEGGGGEEDPPGAVLKFTGIPLSGVTLEDDGQRIIAGPGVDNFANAKKVQTDRAIEVGDFVAVAATVYDPSAAGGPALGFSPSAGGQFGLASVMIRPADAIVGGDIVATGGNYQNGTTIITEPHEVLFILDRRDVDAQRLLYLSIDYGCMREIDSVDVTAALGAGATYFGACLLGPGAEVHLHTQTEMETISKLWQRSMWEEAKSLDELVFLSDPLELDPGYEALAPRVWTEGMGYGEPVVVGFNLTVAMFSDAAYADVYTHIHFMQADWVEGPDTRETVLAACNSAGFGAILIPGNRWVPGMSWVEAYDFTSDADDLYADSRVSGFCFYDEPELNLIPASTLIAQYADWTTQIGSAPTGKPCQVTLMGVVQTTDDDSVRGEYFNMTEITAFMSDMYPRMYGTIDAPGPDEPLLCGGALPSAPKGPSIMGSCTIPGSGITAYMGKFGPHHSQNPNAVGRPHGEWISTCAQSSNPVISAPAQLPQWANLEAWSSVMCGADTIGWFSTMPGVAGNIWDTGMVAYAEKFLRNERYLHAGGFLFNTSNTLRSPVTVRRSPPMIVSAWTGEGTDDHGHTYQDPWCVHYLMGGWMASRFYKEDLSDYVTLLLNMEDVQRTLTLPADDPWYDDLNGRVVEGHDCIVIDSDGVLDTTFELLAD